MSESTPGVRPEQFPVPRRSPFGVQEEYRTIRDTEPVAKVRMPGDTWAWVLTRHADVTAMLTDPRFSADRRNPRFPVQVPGERPGEDDRRMAKSLLILDGDEHGRVRGPVTGEFGPRSMAAWRPRIQEIVDERIDALLAGPKPADLVKALGLPVPSIVICELLGVPYEDTAFFYECARRMLDRDIPGDQRMASVGALMSYLDDLVGAKEQAPTEADLIGRQIRRGRERGDYDHGELADLAYLLLIAGYETTANMIALGTVALLSHPDQLALLRRDPSVTPKAVEELLRYFTIAEFSEARVAVADAEIGGCVIRAGEGVLGLTHVANRDPEVFGDPDAFDITRTARNHLGFGHGPHRCLGQALARVELQVVFDTLFSRLPGLALAVPFEDLPFKDNVSVYGMHSLPVTW
jgi:cytochrome P450